MRVDSNCSTTFDTWLDENTILYNVCLVATRDTGFSGERGGHNSQLGCLLGRQHACLGVGLGLSCTVVVTDPLCSWLLCSVSEACLLQVLGVLTWLLRTLRPTPPTSTPCSIIGTRSLPTQQT